MTRLGILLSLLLLLCWTWQLRDPCGPAGEAWLQCKAHHQTPTTTEAP